MEWGTDSHSYHDAGPGHFTSMSEPLATSVEKARPAVHLGGEDLAKSHVAVLNSDRYEARVVDLDSVIERVINLDHKRARGARERMRITI